MVTENLIAKMGAPVVGDRKPPIAILGVPFDNVTVADTRRIFGEMIASKKPHYVATANVDFVVQALGDVELRRILADADLILCDGMPLVWASRLLGNALPERVTGSDMVPKLLADAEQNGWRVFFLGGKEESIARATANVRAKHPKIQLVGAYSPPFKPLLEMDQEDILRRIKEVQPDILLVAFGCPKQEKWIRMNFEQAGVPLSIGVGATIDFLGGIVKRAPVWMQRTGLEWIFRLLQEPRRLFRRYFTDFWVFGRAILRQWWALRGVRNQAKRLNPVSSESGCGGTCEVVRCSERLDAATVREYEELWKQLAACDANLIFDLHQVNYLDSTGVGLLVRMQKQLRGKNRQLVLAAATPQVQRVLALMKFTEFFALAADLNAARLLIADRAGEKNVVMTVEMAGKEEVLVWQGDIVAVNEEAVWKMTKLHLEAAAGRGAGLTILLAEVRFIDSAGVRVMLKTRKEALKLGLKLKFAAASPPVLNVLRILRLEVHLLG